MPGIDKISIWRDCLQACTFVFFIFLSGCGPMESTVSRETALETSFSPECIKAINSSRILFAHMSVGDDILSGLAGQNSALKEPIAIYGIDAASRIDAQKKGIRHIKIGANAQPLEKLSNFRQFLFSNDNGRSCDLVGIKFCFVDITEATDVHALLNAYTALVKEVKERYPHITFVHFTVPLTTHYSSLKNRIKHMILGDQDNMKRTAYNELLCETYKNEAIIDIARIESTYPDGSRLKHAYFKNSYYSLVPAYTTDGGHLNDAGKKRVAAPFAAGLCRALAK
jgi:hypothetical protein